MFNRGERLGDMAVHWSGVITIMYTTTHFLLLTGSEETVYKMLGRCEGHCVLLDDEDFFRCLCRQNRQSYPANVTCRQPRRRYDTGGS